MSIEANDYKQFDAMPTEAKDVLLKWIELSLEPRKRLYDSSSYGLKHEFETFGFYVNNGQFKGAMLQAGFAPADYEALNWRFCCKPKSSGSLRGRRVNPITAQIADLIDFDSLNEKAREIVGASVRPNLAPEVFLSRLEWEDKLHAWRNLNSLASSTTSTTAFFERWVAPFDDKWEGGRSKLPNIASSGACRYFTQQVIQEIEKWYVDSNMEDKGEWLYFADYVDKYGDAATDGDLVSSKPTKANGKGNVYFINDGQYIKIGFTSGDVENRMSQLQTGNPNKLSLAGWLESERSEETRLHEHFAPYRAEGEWFRVNAELTAFIDSRCKKLV